MRTAVALVVPYSYMREQVTVIRKCVHYFPDCAAASKLGGCKSLGLKALKIRELEHKW